MKKIHTSGTFNLTFHGGSLKKIKEVGWSWVSNVTFTPGAREANKFLPEHAELVIAASEAHDKGGGLYLEITPMQNGIPDDTCRIPVKLASSLTLKKADDISFKIRFKYEDLENEGLVINTLITATLNLYCDRGNQPSLGEATDSNSN